MRVLKENSVYKMNSKNLADGLLLLGDINAESVTTAFYDPQYRGVLDKLNYGNEGVKRGKGRCNLTQMGEDTILAFIREIDRVLMPTGYLMLWVDKYHLCEGVQAWTEGTNLSLVDLITWEKPHIGMGYRSRHKSEFLLVFQKKPIKAKATWTDHSIPDVWQESVSREHPHCKPIELQKRLITATTHEGDVVLDPAAGSFSVLTACRETGRNFIGGDIEFGVSNQIDECACKVIFPVKQHQNSFGKIALF